MQDNNPANSPILKDTSSVDEAVPEATNNQTEPIEPTSSNKRIAKNALMLYVRMFLTMIVGLYTSRVVLNTLGVEDYGIYGVVGGVVSMLGFLNASMSGATSRFLTFELGRGDKKRLRDTFSSALIVHIGIALVVFVLAETVGLWFLTHKLVIPEGRMTAAHWVYQCSILSAMLGITQAPYNATIIAHEKMDIYAYVEILNVTLKLLIVYLLVIGNFDKLILYAILVLAVSVLIMMVYRIYCIRHFSESHFHWIWNPSILKPLLSFSGWDLYGNISTIVYNNGIAFVLNIFLGPLVNAANSIAMMVNGIAKSFAYNMIQAFRPQIIIKYSSREMNDMESLVLFSSMCSILMMSLVLVPCIFDGGILLALWLVKVPENTLFMLRIVLISCVFDIAKAVINIPIHATGQIYKLSFWTGNLYILCPVLIYVCLKLGLNLYWAYAVLVPTQLVILCTSLFVLKGQITSFRISKLLLIYLRCSVIILSSVAVIYVTRNLVDSKYLKLLVDSVLNVFMISTLCVVLMPKKYRESLSYYLLRRKNQNS